MPMSKPILIMPKVYQLPALKPSCNCYLITGEKNTLIDVGIRENIDYIEKQLQELNLSISDINDIIYTHCHYDHTGAGEFFPHATVYAHPLCQDKLYYQEDYCIHALKYRIPLPTRIPDTTLETNDYYQNGDYKFLIIHTLGHSDDGICLLDIDKKLLISGDTVFAKGVPPLITNSGSDASLINSIKKLQEYDIEIILPGHGKVDHDGNNTLIKTQANIIKRIQKNNKKTIEEATSWQSTKY